MQATLTARPGTIEMLADAHLVTLTPTASAGAAAAGVQVPARASGDPAAVRPGWR